MLTVHEKQNYLPSAAQIVDFLEQTIDIANSNVVDTSDVYDPMKLIPISVDRNLQLSFNILCRRNRHIFMRLFARRLCQTCSSWGCLDYLDGTYRTSDGDVISETYFVSSKGIKMYISAT